MSSMHIIWLSLNARKHCINEKIFKDINTDFKKVQHSNTSDTNLVSMCDVFDSEPFVQIDLMFLHPLLVFPSVVRVRKQYLPDREVRLIAHRHRDVTQLQLQEEGLVERFGEHLVWGI